LLRAEHLDPSSTWVRERLAYVEGMLRVAQAERAEAEALVTRMIGRKAWLTLGEASRLALVASEVAWRQLRGIEGPADYGSTVGQAARAVELELQRRLFSPYREYLLRALGREGLLRIASEDNASVLLPFLRFLRAPHGGLSLGPMLAVADTLATGGEASGSALGLLRRYVDTAYASPARVRELLADPELAVLNATRNQGLHRATVGLEAASRCRSFVLGESAGKGWLTAMTQLLVPRMVDQVLGRALLSAATSAGPSRG
jgi:hypothetical protein